jgi:hypothetical protein
MATSTSADSPTCAVDQPSVLLSADHLKRGNASRVACWVPHGVGGAEDAGQQTSL